MDIIVVVIGAVIGLIASMLSAWQSKRDKRELKVVRERAEKQLAEALYQHVLDYSKDYIPTKPDEPDRSRYWKALIEESASTSASAMVSTPSMSKEDIQNEIDEKVTFLKSRIAEVEERLPARDTVDKLASVNDAILATQIENLSDSLKKLEQGLLSRWDVAKIVFLILGAIGGFISVILGLISYLKSV